MNEIMLLGWTGAQWAHAKARHAKQTGETAPPTLQGLLAVKAWWAHSNRGEPLGVVFEGIEYEFDRQWFAKALEDNRLYSSSGV